MPPGRIEGNENGRRRLWVKRCEIRFGRSNFMTGLVVLLLYTIETQGKIQNSKVGNALGNVRIGGYVGCKISNNVCLKHEYCEDDDLFGTCRSYKKTEIPAEKYRLTTSELEELGSLLESLASLGYKWRHFYTQCAVTSLLLTYKGEAVIDPSICKTVTQLISDPPNIELPLPPEEAAYLQNEEFDYIIDPEIQQEEGFVTGDDSARNFFGGYAEGDVRSRADDLEDPTGAAGIEEGFDNSAINSLEKKSYWPLDADEGQEVSQDVDYLDELFSGLSKEDIETLKKMILQESGVGPVEAKREPIRHAETHFSPDLVTTVEVKYNPPEDEDEDTESEEEDYEEGEVEDPPDTEGDSWLKYMHPDLRKETGVRDDLYNGYDENREDEKDQVDYYDSNEEDKQNADSNKVIHQSLGEKAPTLAPPQQGPLRAPNLFPTMSRTASPEKFDDAKPLHSSHVPAVLPMNNKRQRYLITMFILCGIVAALILAATVLYLVRRHARFHNKFSQWSSGGKGDAEATGEYQDLCRAHMQSKLSEKVETTPTAARKSEAIQSSTTSVPARGVTSSTAEPIRTTSTGSSSTSSWTEEPVNSNMDISTGHLVLSYMENHLQNKDRLQKEWDMLCAYDPEPCSIVAAIEPTNMRKNRYTDILPYEHCRVKLNVASSISNSDYINASNIMDHDPRNPAYIVTQGPLPHTVADFWQMVWEQGSVVIVNLTKLVENSVTVCNRYWPEEGSDLYHIYEVHLVSEHSWSEDYVVRSFYLKNLQTNETRTITQFHYLSWPNLAVPSSPKPLLEFRRKVNKSYKGRSCPVIVHCSDGAGRSGTYCLIDMVLNRLSKGAKEIDISATLEHIRDQRVNMVGTKEQFEFALSAVAQEVHTMLQSPGS